MFWFTNKQSHFVASVVELDEQLRQKTATQMDKDVGQLNLQNLFWTY